MGRYRAAQPGALNSIERDPGDLFLIISDPCGPMGSWDVARTQWFVGSGGPRTPSSNVMSSRPAPTGVIQTAWFVTCTGETMARSRRGPANGVSVGTTRNSNWSRRRAAGCRSLRRGLNAPCVSKDSAAQPGRVARAAARRRTWPWIRARCGPRGCSRSGVATACAGDRPRYPAQGRRTQRPRPTPGEDLRARSCYPPAPPRPTPSRRVTC